MPIALTDTQNNGGSVSHIEKQQAGATLSAQALREFERLFLDWLDRNQDQLQAGGTGNVAELAESLATARLTSKVGDQAQMIQDRVAASGSAPEARRVETDTDRLSSLLAEIDRRSKLHSATRIFPSP